MAKITPKKIGQFVTFWKRQGDDGPILPYDFEDGFDFLIVSVRKDLHYGQFVFSKAILKEKRILSVDSKKGKLAMRVYPPWDQPDSKQGKETQAWQVLYFFETHEGQGFDVSRVRYLFNLT